MKTVFFYGLFMDKDLLTEKGLNPQKPQAVCLKTYGLRIGNRATIEQSSKECCYGVVMELSEKEIKNLYADTSVADYLPQNVITTNSMGESIKAVSYILPMDQVTGRNSNYAKKLLNIAFKLNLPTDYIKEIQTWI